MHPRFLAHAAIASQHTRFAARDRSAIWLRNLTDEAQVLVAGTRLTNRTEMDLQRVLALIGASCNRGQLVNVVPDETRMCASVSLRVAWSQTDLLL